MNCGPDSVMEHYMKKALFLLACILFAGNMYAQNILSGYNGFWSRPEIRSKGVIDIFDLVEFYPDKLPYVRNEIYARYGRPFETKVYQDYFLARPWYRALDNFTDAWLSDADKKNAEFIRSVEQPALDYNSTFRTIVRNLEYRGRYEILTFSYTEVLISDNSDALDIYGSNYKEPDSWVIVGDWILCRTETYKNAYQVKAFRLDHNAKTITVSESGRVGKVFLDALIQAQKNRR
jgi:hypothetical protein